jgi:hypothetical protein
LSASSAARLLAAGNRVSQTRQPWLSRTKTVPLKELSMALSVCTGQSMQKAVASSWTAVKTGPGSLMFSPGRTDVPPHLSSTFGHRWWWRRLLVCSQQRVPPHTFSALEFRWTFAIVTNSGTSCTGYKR